MRLDTSIAENLPNLTSLVLTSNHLAHLAEIDALIGVTTQSCFGGLSDRVCVLQAKLLRNLSLHDNDMSKKLNYRAYVLFRLPQLKVRHAYIAGY